MSMGLLFALICAGLALVYGAVSVKWILSKPTGTDRMVEISNAVQEGASAYLNRQYTTIGIAGVVLLILIGIFLDWATAIGFGITKRCRDYLEPLIAGEDYPPYGKDGMPKYVQLKNVPVKKKLEKAFKVK